MIDVKHPLRKAYYECLNGNLTFKGLAIPVGDDTVDFDGDVYVVLASQTGYDNGTFQTFDSVETIDIDIVGKARHFSNKNVVDFIANQIVNLIQPTKQTYGLPDQDGVQINCISLSADRYLTFSLNDSNSVVRRILTYKQKVRQISSGVIGDFSDDFSNDFNN